MDRFKAILPHERHVAGLRGRQAPGEEGGDRIAANCTQSAECHCCDCVDVDSVGIVVGVGVA